MARSKAGLGLVEAPVAVEREAARRMRFREVRIERQSLVAQFEQRIERDLDFGPLIEAAFACGDSGMSLGIKVGRAPTALANMRRATRW